MVSQQCPGLGGALGSHKDLMYVGEDKRDDGMYAGEDKRDCVPGSRPGRSTQEP